AHLEVIHAGDDALITSQISAARRWIEAVCERALMPQVWRLNLDAFQTVIELPGGLVRVVNLVQYTDFAGETQTLAAGLYQTDLDRQPARLLSAARTCWPATDAVVNAVRIEYQVGYANAGAVPEELKAALKLIVGDIYANREAQQDLQLYSNTTVDRLLWPYRRVII
ncbi:MAG: head-tail connector protein, partial [Solimonas sp.]